MRAMAEKCRRADLCAREEDTSVEGRSFEQVVRDRHCEGGLADARATHKSQQAFVLPHSCRNDLLPLRLGERESGGRGGK